MRPLAWWVDQVWANKQIEHGRSFFIPRHSTCTTIALALETPFCLSRSVFCRLYQIVFSCPYPLWLWHPHFILYLFPLLVVKGKPLFHSLQGLDDATCLHSPEPCQSLNVVSVRSHRSWYSTTGCSLQEEMCQTFALLSVSYSIRLNVTSLS